MYPSTSSSSSQKLTELLPTGLTRYGSASGSYSPRRWDSVIRAKRELNALRSPPLPLIGHYFSGDSSSITFESNYKVYSSLHRSSHGLNEIVTRIGSSLSSNPEKIVSPSVKLGLDLLPNVINGSRNFRIYY